MKTKDKIIDILMDGLENIYCSNCRGKELDEYSEGFDCDWCHRRNMNWRISKSYAEEIADKILSMNLLKSD